MARAAARKERARAAKLEKKKRQRARADAAAANRKPKQQKPRKPKSERDASADRESDGPREVAARHASGQPRVERSRSTMMVWLIAAIVVTSAGVVYWLRTR